MHRLHVEIEGEIPGPLVGLENGSGMNIAGAVEQDVGKADAPGGGLDFLLLQDIEPERLDARLLGR